MNSLRIRTVTQTLLAPMLVASTLLAAPGAASAQGWQLYDNFNKGSRLNPKKWGRSQTNGGADIDLFKRQLRVRFRGNQIVDGQRGWATILQNPHTVRGVRFKVQMGSCTGDVRARFGTYTGKPPGSTHRVWSSLEVRNNRRRVVGTTQRLKRNNAFLFSYLWAEMPSDISSERFRKPFFMEVVWDDREIVFTVNKGRGDERVTTYRYPHAIRNIPKKEAFTAFGLRSNGNGNGPCTALFDNVEIMRAN